MEGSDYRYYTHFEGFYTTFNPADQPNREGIEYLFKHALSVWDSLPSRLPDIEDVYGDRTDLEIRYALNHPEEWHSKEDSDLYTALLIYRASFYRAKDKWPLRYEITPYYTAMRNAGYTMGLEFGL